MKIEIYKEKIIEANTTKENWYYTFQSYYSKKEEIQLCVGCNSYAEAKLYVERTITPKYYLINNIAEGMYNEDYITRLAYFGKHQDAMTLRNKKKMLQKVLDEYGNRDLRKLQVLEVEKYLFADSHKSSYKNAFISVIKEIYIETKYKCPQPVPLPTFTLFHTTKKKADILSLDEMEHFFEPKFWKNKTLYLMYRLMAGCGLRAGEAQGLMKYQIDFKNKILIVDGFLKHNFERTHYNKGGNLANPKIRITPIPDELLCLLQDYCENLNENDYLFRSIHNNLYDKAYITFTFKKQIKKAGIEVGDRKLCPHSLRYTYVTRMRRLLPGEVVRKIVGHVNMQMTDYYTKPNINEMIDGIKFSEARKAVNKMYT